MRKYANATVFRLSNAGFDRVMNGIGAGDGSSGQGGSGGRRSAAVRSSAAVISIVLFSGPNVHIDDGARDGIGAG